METVATMRNENSGVPAKLRTYVPIRAAGLGVKCHTANDGGATVDLSSDTLDYAKHTTGYWVGGLDKAILIPTGSRASKYGYALAAIYSKWGEARYAGFWNDGQGMIHAEPVDWVEDRATALYRGAYRGEAAIFDIAAGEDINLKM